MGDSAAAESDAAADAAGRGDEAILSLPTITTEAFDVGARPDFAALSEPVEVTLWHAIAQDHEAALNDVIMQFEAMPEWGGKIDVKSVHQGAYGDLRTALIAAMGTPSRPVMSQLYESWTSQFAERDLLVPVQVFVDADSDYGEADLSDFYPGFLDNNRWGETLVTLPFNKSVYLLFANTTLLDEAGLGIPTTWAELGQASKALTNLANNRYGLGGRPLMETFTPLFLMNQGEFIDGEGHLQLDSEPSRETVEFLLQITHDDKAMYIEQGYLSSGFGNQSLALFTGSSAGIPYIHTAVGGEFEWTVAQIPVRDADDPPRALSQGTNVGIFNGHPPEVQWAAWEFLKYLTGAESSAHYASVTGYMPIRRSSLEVEELKSKLEQDPIMQVAVSQLEFATFEPRMPQWESIRSVLNRQVGLFLQNPTDAARAVARMQREALRSLEE
jgi:multiple sugar transport system substrate-binding protein